MSGVINIVEKVPEREEIRYVEGGIGSYGLVSGAFDINQPLSADGDLAFRLTGDVKSEGDYVEPLDRTSRSLYPTLRFDDGQSVAQFRARYQMREYDLYPGLPTEGQAAPMAGVSERDFFAALDQPRTHNEAFGFDILLERKLNSNLTGRFDAGWQHAQGEQFSTVSAPSPFFGTGNAGQITRVDSVQYSDIDLYDIGAEVVYELDVTDNVQTVLLGGLEYQGTFFDFDSAFTTTAFDDLESLQSTSFIVGSTTAASHDFETKTAIFQSQTSIYDRWHVLAAVSMADVHVDIEGNPELVLDDDIASPRLGLAYEINDHITPFVGWGKGFRAPPGTASGSAFFNNGTVAIERNQQYEVGLRFENLERGVSGSLAYFNLKRKDAAVFVTTDAQTGTMDVADQKSEGVELDVVWQPTKNWQFITAYAYTDAEIDDADSDFDGKNLQRVPEHSARLAGQYSFLHGTLKGLSLGSGLTVMSERPGDLGNTFTTEQLALVDAQASYKINNNMEATLAVENLTDQEAYVPNFIFQGNVAPLTPLSVRAGLRMTF